VARRRTRRPAWHPSTVRVLVVGDRGDSDPGFVGGRLEQLGGQLTLLLRDTLTSTVDGPDLDGVDLVVLLGSADGVVDPGREAVVEAESSLLRGCLSRGVPVVGICYGAQLAAHALGGTVTKGGARQIGWYFVESHDPALCPPGPWLQYHDDWFTVPDSARLIGMSDVGPQGFAIETADGRLQLVAWQFHPEVTPTILTRWVAEDVDALPRRGVDPAAFVAETRQREIVARAAAHALIDVTLDAMGLVRAQV
jgi:GMP synthase (glutamine-hydrolysing)